MSGLAARIDRPVIPAQAAPERAASAAGRVEFLLRLATFVALAAFALGHWLSVIEHPPVGDAFLLLALCAAAATALRLTAAESLPPVVARTARVLIVLVLVFLALLVSGVSARYLVPHGWGAFGRHLNHGLLGAQSSLYPYGGGDRWVRVTLMLAGPAFLVPATALAFWPARRAAGVLRGASLVLLLVLFGMAIAERSPGGQIGRGFALMLLIAAWLWLPRLTPRDALAAGLAVVTASLVALPVAAKLDASRGWIDYRNWRPLTNTAGVDYQWNHSYGPIDWPRRGTTLLYVRADRPYYWKAETLNDFDGRRWFRSPGTTNGGPGSELPAAPEARWFKKISVTVAALRGNLVVGAGTPQSVSGAGDIGSFGDGTTTALDHPLQDGENYSFTTYLPEPTTSQLRAAPRGYAGDLGTYTRFTVPVSIRGAPAAQAATIDPGLWPDSSPADPNARLLLDRSPYAPMYRLATRLAAGAPTAYEVVRRIEDYLNTSRFAYDEHPTLRRYPLESFLFRDRVGYCQQFSGTMALMLRMVGIPARVATGFAPGTPLPNSPGVYRVRDLDAHSWVEVYFTGIGWVTFDPTPAVAPASLQSDDVTSGSLGKGRTPRALGQSGGADPIGSASGLNLPGGHGSSLAWWVPPAALAALAALVVLAIWLRVALRRGHRLSTEEHALRDLRLGLARLGNPLAEDSTLVTVEALLERRAGPEASRYARLLREHRYGSDGAGLPGRRDRRRLRRALARTARPFGMLKALRALPPVHF